MFAAPTPTMADLCRVELLACHLEGIVCAREYDGSGALLVVMPDGDGHLLTEFLEYVEALGAREVFEVDASEGGLDPLDRLYDLLGVLRGEADGEGVDASQVLEDEGLALHDGHAGLAADVSEAEDASPIGYDSDVVPLARPLVGELLVLLYVLADLGDAGGVPDAEVLKCAYGALWHHLDLAVVEGVVGWRDLAPLLGFLE